MAGNVVTEAILVFAFLFCTAAGQSSLPDPCHFYSNLSDPLRSTFQQPRQTDTLLCDRFLLPGWYRFLEGLIPTSCIEPFRCGTHAPIWMQGTVPAPQEGIVPRTACVNARTGTEFAGSCCSIQIPLEVKNCGNFVVYNLRPSPGCPMSYCVESPPVLPAAPRLIGPEILQNRFRFACSIAFPSGSDGTAFDVMWSFDGSMISGLAGTTLTGDDRVVYLDQKYWAGNIGKTLRCHVRPYYTSLASVRGSYIDSNGYWGGIEISPKILSVSEGGDEQTVNVSSTLPFLCDSSQDCHVPLDMDVQGGLWEELAATSDCRLKLTRDDWNPVRRMATVSTNVLATRDFIDDGDHQLVLNFNPDFAAVSDIWRGYTFPGAKVTTLDGVTRRCYAFSDPHIRGLERPGVYHLYDEGDYVFLRSKFRPFEVHIRSWPCAGRGCICAVVIREGNDLISIDLCQNTGNIPARLSVLSGNNVAPGTTIHRSRDGQTFMIGFESGNWMRVKDFGAYLNVEVQATSRDFGSLEGICGTFDNNFRNEFVSPRGMIFADSDFPADFMRSWRIHPEQSLFTGQFTRSLVTAPRPSFSQRNQCMCKTSSNLAECGTTKAIKDPNILTIKNYMDITTSVCSHTNVITQNFLSTVSTSAPQLKQVINLVAPTVTITESEARKMCRDSLLNITLGVNCSQVLTAHLSGFMSACVQDTMLTGSDLFVRGMAAAFEVSCQEAVIRNISTYKQDDEGRRVPPQDVTSMMCPNQCSLRGRCGDGICRCNPGYTGDDCSVEADKPPEVVNVRSNGLCDGGQETCKSVLLVVNNFMETPDTSCRVRQVKEDNGILEPDQTPHPATAEFHSNREVTCHLPSSAVSGNSTVDRYMVSVSTDGQKYSNEINYTVFDPNCRQCAENGSCSLKPGTCLIDDKCRHSDERNPDNANQVCDPSISQMSWTTRAMSTTTAEVTSSTTEAPPIAILEQNDEPQPRRLSSCTCEARNDYYERWDIWTSNSTGCQCDSSDPEGECACCEVGACRCPSPNQNQCVMCGKEEVDCGTRRIAPEFGIDAWTRKLDGCQCPFNRFRYNCACCQNNACHCGPAHPNQCAPCWSKEVCGSKPDVFGTV